MSGNGLALVAMLAIPAGLGLMQTARAQTTAAPTRTMGSGAAGVRAVSDDAGAGNASGPQAGFNTAAVIERYRQMWQRMTPAQQKVFIQNGGRTPEDYERMLKGSVSQFVPRAEGSRTAAPARGSDPKDAGRAVDSGALDSLSKSLQDLNAIRDGNLGRIQKDGCPPGVASRITDLRGQLQSDEFDLNGGRPSAAMPTAGPPEKPGQADPLAVAGDWFKRPSGQKSPGPDPASGNTPEGKLLDAVLTGAQPAAPKPSIDPSSPEVVQKRKVLEEDIARIKTEIGQLSGACATNKQ